MRSINKGSQSSQYGWYIAISLMVLMGMDIHTAVAQEQGLKRIIPGLAKAHEIVRALMGVLQKQS